MITRRRFRLKLTRSAFSQLIEIVSLMGHDDIFDPEHSCHSCRDERKAQVKGIGRVLLKINVLPALAWPGQCRCHCIL